MTDRKKSLATSISRNLQDFKNGYSLSDLFNDHPARDRHTTRISDKVLLATRKLNEGDVRSAVRHLASDDSVALPSEEVMNSLRQKHPPERPGVVMPPPPVEAEMEVPITTKQVKDALFSFPSSFSGGFDCLRPRHLRDLLALSGEHEVPLLLSLTELCNQVISGKLPEFLLPFFYGASLTALTKKCGGLRSIACGLTLRRLTTKAALRREMPTLSAVLLPNQVGCGVRNGCEAAVHATRVYIRENSNSGKVVLKMDFRNAFNGVRRDWMLSRVRQYCPSLFPHQAYFSKSHLLSTGGRLESATGVQQGDPAGLAFFCLSIKELTDRLRSELNVWYLDDGTIGGPVDVVLKDIQRVLEFSEKTGLALNFSKCEVFALSDCPALRHEICRKVQSIFPGGRCRGQR